MFNIPLFTMLALMVVSVHIGFGLGYGFSLLYREGRGPIHDTLQEVQSTSGWCSGMMTIVCLCFGWSTAFALAGVLSPVAVSLYKKPRKRR
jgi:ABC-type spermidine/putrescine transport system permease subunit I